MSTICNIVCINRVGYHLNKLVGVKSMDMKDNGGLVVELTKEEAEFLNSILEAQKYKLIFESNVGQVKKGGKNLEITDSLEGKINHVLGY